MPLYDRLNNKSQILSLNILPTATPIKNEQNEKKEIITNKLFMIIFLSSFNNLIISLLFNFDTLDYLNQMEQPEL